MIDFNTKELLPLCEKFGLLLDYTALSQLERYGNMLLEYNEKVNLTAITEPREVLYKHFYDCLLFLKNTPLKGGNAVIDVGTGAGFPGLVLKIACPDINLTLLDGLNKRLDFLKAVLKELDLNAALLHARAEDAAKDAALRETFDVACARAVAALPALCEMCLPFVKKGGVFTAMKGAGAETEVAAAQNAVKILGGEISGVFYETLTGDEKRAFVNIKKVSQTPTKYPRQFSKIKKSPL